MSALPSTASSWPRLAFLVPALLLPFPVLPFMGLFASGCSASSADLAPIRTALDSGSQLALAGNLALSAFAGTSVSSCVAVTAGCGAGYPCQAAATITLGSGCALPYGDGPSGTVQVSGSFSSADSGELSTTFVDARAGLRSLAVVSARSLKVDRSGNALTVRYTGQNVNTQGGTLAAQSTWTVTVDGRGTADPGDDIYTVDGTDQTVGTTVDQFNLQGAVLDPACRRNPTSGSATIQHVSILSIKQETVSFHAACDGQVEVSGSGSKQTLALDEP